ncbi:hypothetical protein BASA81_017212 [Batrachochytrium salamandrivorans]|nr:hypothetical protein BASA81_017212 [Batrachochytrium salamandrivorans]
MGKAYYGLELVGGNKSHLAPLQTTINKGIRLFTGARLSTAIGPLLAETGIGSLLTRSLVSRVETLHRSKNTRFEPPISVAQQEIPRQAQDTVEENPTASRTTTTDTHTAAISSTPTPTQISYIGSDDILTVLLGGSLPGTNTAGNTEACPGQQWLTVDHCILCDQQLLSISIAHLVVECEQVTGHRIQSGLVPAIQKSRLRLLGRSTRSGCGECIYLAPRWSLKWQSRSGPIVGWTGTVEH